MYISSMLHDFPSEHVVQAMMSLLTSAITMPLAYYYNSKLLGFISITGLYGYLGFFVAGMFGGYVIGFEDDAAVGNCVYVSVAFNTALVLAKFYHIDIKRFEMFQTPVLTMANVVLFLALLIHASDWRTYYEYYSKSEDEKAKIYWKHQLQMMGSLGTAMFVGTYYNYPAMTNTALVYSGLYALQKTAEYRSLWSGKNIVLSVFGLSVVGWRLALYLHQNPQIITGMFKFEN